MAKKKSGGGSKREILVVASKVKAYVRGKSMNTASESIEAISNRVYDMIDAATTRTSNNGRKTLKAYDL